MAQAVCFFMRKNKRIKALKAVFIVLIMWDVINHVGCFDFWGVWLQIMPKELFSR